MKITCQACQAKYTIADEKVVGKVVKIRCKKCGATIVVNGNETSSGSQPPGAGEEGGDAALTVGGNASEPWTVNVADGDQRVMTEPELVAAYRAGVVTNDTYCWRDGMPDWAPIAELGPLYAACTAPGAAAGEFPAKGQDTSAAGVPTRTSTPPAAPPRVSTSPKDRNGAPAATTSATAARRAGGRAAAADLFRGAAQAGGEDEVMTSAPPSLPAPGDGARAASKDTGAAAPSMTATTEASGLIDIRQLGQQMRPAHDEKKKTRVDDIMNIGGGGGGFGPSLAAPVLTAPSLEHYSQPPPGLLAGPVASQVKSRALMIVAVSAGFFFLVAAVGVIVLIVRGTGPGEERDRASTGSTSAAAGSTMGAATGAASGTAAASAESPAASGHPSETASAAPSESAGAAASASAGKEAPSDTGHPVAATAPKAFVAPAAPKEAPAAPSGGGEFNLGEARARLGAIAGGVQTCKRGDTSGSGKVEIVFGASGAAQSATLLGGSPFDGTPTGKCVEARFRQARVPPFGGSPTTVTKSFNIN